MTYIPFLASAMLFSGVYPSVVKFKTPSTPTPDDPTKIEFHAYTGRTHQAPCSGDEMAGYRDHTLWHRNPVGGDPISGPVRSLPMAIWKDRHLWQVRTGSVNGLYYAKLTTPKNGKVYADGMRLVLQFSSNYDNPYILYVYKDEIQSPSVFLMLISLRQPIQGKGQIETWIEFSALQPEGPWAATGRTWPIGLVFYDYYTIWPRDIGPLDSIVTEIATFIKYKTGRELQLGYVRSGGNKYGWVLKEAFLPPWWVDNGGPEPPSGLIDINLEGTWKNKDIISIDDDYMSPLPPVFLSVLRRGAGIEPIVKEYDELWEFEHPYAGQPVMPCPP